MLKGESFKYRTACWRGITFSLYSEQDIASDIEVRERNDWKMILSSYQQPLHFIAILGHPGVFHVPIPAPANLFFGCRRRFWKQAEQVVTQEKTKTILPLNIVWVWVVIARKSHERVSQHWYNMKEGPWREVLVLADLLGCVLAPPCCNERVGGKRRFAAGSRHPWTP